MNLGFSRSGESRRVSPGPCPLPSYSGSIWFLLIWRRAREARNILAERHFYFATFITSRVLVERKGAKTERLRTQLPFLPCSSFRAGQEEKVPPSPLPCLSLSRRKTEAKKKTGENKREPNPPSLFWKWE